jgi:hypothetical protein
VRKPGDNWRQGTILVATLETAILCCLGLLAIFWIIPSQTSGNALGLEPSFMPTLYTAAFVVLILMNGVLQLARRSAITSVTEGAVGPVTMVFGICCLGVAVFEYFGAVACSALVVPLIMVALRERRWILIVSTTVVFTAGLALVFI